ncbi:MAG: amidohydrolase family protein [Solirubrobacteraceae bacterium]|nr:amidohydrolase family protein [Solirubrobacteraceae bacterium]
MPGVDTHQHLWSEHLWEALARRRQAPFLDQDAAGWTLHLPAEPACRLDGPDDAARRLALLDLDGMDGAIVAPSLALGLEWLPEDEAHALIAAHREGIEASGPRFDRWAVVPLASARDAAATFLQAELDGGAIGLCLGSSALASAECLDRVGPLLEVLARAGAPLFIHPGPGPESWTTSANVRWNAEPWWWPGLTDYVAGMQRAWFTWAAHGRRRHPELRVLFAMLGGLAPLQVSRLAARGAPGAAARASADPLTFYDTSSYDPTVQRAVAHVVGEQQLVHGSDRPVIAGNPAGAIPLAQSTTNAELLFGKAA